MLAKYIPKRKIYFLCCKTWKKYQLITFAFNRKSPRDHVNATDFRHDKEIKSMLMMWNKVEVIAEAYIRNK